MDKKRIFSVKTPVSFESPKITTIHSRCLADILSWTAVPDCLNLQVEIKAADGKLAAVCIGFLL